MADGQPSPNALSFHVPIKRSKLQTLNDCSYTGLPSKFSNFKEISREDVARTALIEELRQKIKSGSYEIPLQILTHRIFELIKPDLLSGNYGIDVQIH